VTSSLREGLSTAFAIKAEVRDPRAKTLAFTAQKTMYRGRHIAEGDVVFVSASENEGGAPECTPHKHRGVQQDFGLEKHHLELRLQLRTRASRHLRGYRVSAAAC
jgi:hypothetical protein